MNIGRLQRFGTQYCSTGDGPVRLYEVSTGVTDSLRAKFGVPTLDQARQREAMMDELIRDKKRSTKP